MLEVELIGILGAAIILVFFILNQSGKLSRDSWQYDLGNVVGSGFLVGYALLIDSWPFVILNAVWLLVSLKDLIWKK